MLAQRVDRLVRDELSRPGTGGLPTLAVALDIFLKDP
jgi:hypothetical protein